MAQTTSSASIANVYNRRLVAQTSSKPCYICFKPTPVVLITACQRDFFYVCAGHLLDRGFATPLTDLGSQQEAGTEPKRKEDLQREIEKVKAEWEEKQKRRKAKNKKRKKEVQKDKDGKKIKDDDDDIDDTDELAEEKAKNEQLKKLESHVKADEAKDATDEGPRTLVLHKNVFQMRMQRIQTAQKAKRDNERLKSGTYFPTVPSKGL